MKGFIKSFSEIEEMHGWCVKRGGTINVYHPCGRCLDFGNDFVSNFIGTGVVCEFSLKQIKGNGVEKRELWVVQNDRWKREVYREMITELSEIELESELFEI